MTGRWNYSRTELRADQGENAPKRYEADFVLRVSTDDDKVIVNNPYGVDGIHTKGTVAFPTGGFIGTIPAGNGIVAQGINGGGRVGAAPRWGPVPVDPGRELLAPEKRDVLLGLAATQLADGIADREARQALRQAGRKAIELAARRIGHE